MKNFKLINEGGNAIYFVEAEDEMETLISRGFTLCEDSDGEKPKNKTERSIDKNERA